MVQHLTPRIGRPNIGGLSPAPRFIDAQFGWQILLLFPVAVLGLAEFRAAQNRASIVHGLLRFEACTAPLDSLK